MRYTSPLPRKLSGIRGKFAMLGIIPGSVYAWPKNSPLERNRPVFNNTCSRTSKLPQRQRLDRLLHHGHVLKCGPRSWRKKAAAGGAQWYLVRAGVSPASSSRTVANE